MPVANQFNQHLTNWLGKQGYRLPAAPEFRYDYGKAGATSTDQGILFSANWKPHVESLAARYGKRGRMDPDEVNALQTVLHEMLHQPLVNREPGWYDKATPDDRLWEEAAAEQAAIDLMPAATKQLFGFAYRPPSAVNAFERGVDPAVRDRSKRQRAYRQMSTLATGSKNYQDRAARQWRRDFLNAPTTQRAEMRAAAALRRTG